MIAGAQTAPIPYYAGAPVAEKDLPTDANVLALMFEGPAGKTTYWATDPSQDNSPSTVGDDIVITYSFVEDSSSKMNPNDGSSGGPNQPTVWELNTAQKESVRESLQAWSDVADITFVEIQESANSDVVGTMRFGFTTYKGTMEGVAGWATAPGPTFSSGDVWLATTNDSAGVTGRADNNAFQKGVSQGFLTLLHEIGHGLGFGSIRLKNHYSMIPFDNQKYSVMSYTTDDQVWFGNGGYAISNTPMIMDIAAIQWLYGEQETNEGDTIYGLDYFDPVKPFALAIHDSGGTDTIDLSTFTEGCTISLVPGTNSTVTCTGWDIGQLTNNLGIAASTTIENLNAGSGDDVIVGNDAANVLNGGAGNDSLTGGLGADNFQVWAQLRE